MAGRLRTMDGYEHRVGESWHSIECFCCGICCTRYQPQLSPEEAEIIARKLGMSTEDFLPRYAQLTNVGYLLRQSKKGCIFLTWEEDGTRGTCSIYPFRPEACQHWVPSLSRPECRDGLTKLKAKGEIMLANELYPSQEAISRFYKHLLKG